MLNVIEATPSELGEYAKFPMALLVASIFKIDIIDNGFGGFQLVEQRVKTPWVKDYGEEGDDTNVTRWLKQFDVSNWKFLLADVEGRIA